ERERQARIILGTAETEIAHKFVEAAELYRDRPEAMNLRAMNMLYESIAKRGSLMVVPSGLADSLNVPGIMGMAGAAGLDPRGPEDERPSPEPSSASSPSSSTSGPLASPAALAALGITPPDRDRD
ncbi:MAG: hypothetical protein EA350_15380, partial [Gemmatimonadales bacterium]